MYTNIVSRGRLTTATDNNRAGGERMENGMSNDQLNALLETIAKLIESKAHTTADAAQIVREAKTK